MGRIVFENAKLLDRATADATVVVDGARISSVGAGPVQLTPDDEVFDCGGRVLMPGLWMCHMHPEYGLFDFKRTDIPLAAEQPQGVLMVNAVRTAGCVLQTGFTGYVGAGCGFQIDANLRTAIQLGVMAGPRIVACSRHINNTGHYNARAPYWYEMGNYGLEAFADGPDEIRKLVRGEIARGADVIKLYVTGGHGFMSPPETRWLQLDEIDAAVAAAHDRGKLVRAHVSYRERIKECIERGIDIIDHGDELDRELLEMMAERGTYWAPSALYLRKRAAVYPEHKVAERAELKHDWDNIRENLPLAIELGVKIVLGDDFGVNFMPHEVGAYGAELTCYVEEMGVPTAEVLKWATLNGAELAGLKGQCGVIQAGALADFIVIDRSPYDDIRVFEKAAETLQAAVVDGKVGKNLLPRAAAPVVRPAAAVG